MGVKNFIKKSIAFVSAVAMACSMVVMPAGVSYAEEEASKGTLELSKSLTLDSDGIYKIKLEAYATGQDTVNKVNTSKPMDIVLVLDQSGSMAYNMGYEYKEVYSLYTKNSYYILRNNEYVKVTYSTKRGAWRYDGQNITPKTSESSEGEQFYSSSQIKRLDALIDAVNGFVTAVENNANPEKGEKINHRIAIVGFSTSNYNNTEILSGVDISSGNSIQDYNTSYYPNNKSYNGVQYNSTNYEAATATALQDVSTEEGQTNIANAISALTAHGGTQTNHGMQMAKDILDNAPTPEQNAEGRKKLVIMFTDGEPTGNGSSFNTYVAKDAISIAKNIKTSATNPATIYTVGIFSGADPNGTDDANEFMNYVSSNYPKVSSMSDNNPTRVENGKYYKVASNSSELSEVFEQIQNEETTTETTVQLNASSVLRDVISDKFTLPEGVKTSDITAYTVDAKYNGDTLGWDDSTKNSDGLSVEIVGEKNNTVNVTGFDYAAHYVTKAHEEQAKKLVVEIPVNGKVSGKQLASNDSKSGVYANSTDEIAFKNFEQPTVDIPEYSYVLDYGKKVVLPNVDENTMNVFDSTQTQNKNYSATTMMNLDLAAPLSSTVQDKTTLRGTYGTFNLVENSVLTYQPGKINWDGFDSIFTLGQKSDNSYEWYKTNVIPATSVYYEDDFGSFTADNPNKDANVAIVWTGEWSEDSDKLAEGESNKKDNNQSSNNTQYGWDDSYVDDNQYSNGSAHYSSDSTATAKFRFTGTAVDVYSRTNNTVGNIIAKIKKVEKDENGNETLVAKKTAIIDNQSVSGDYYQIPTLNFEMSEYGTYEVTIMVSPVTSETENRLIYYLDGIRVYNPLQGNVTAEEIYDKAGEASAQYIKVRKDLLDSTSVTAIDSEIEGSVFIDKSETKVGDSTDVIGTYKTYGPKNEVYLKEKQGVAFTINNYNPEVNKVFIGLKSPTGKATTALITSGTQKVEETVSSASDLYYEITPTSDGKVVIQNTTNNLLSITKIRITTTSTPSNQSYSLRATPALMSYVDEFDTLSVKEETTEDQDTTLDKDDVEIDNPTEDDVENDNSDEDTEENTNSSSIWDKIMSSIKNWFR